MKKLLAMFFMPFMLTGCIDEIPWIPVYDMTVSLKDNVPCFSFDAEGLRNDQIRILSAQVMENSYYDKEGIAWSETWWEEGKTLKQDECLPFGGESKLKLRTLYMASFYARKKDQQKGKDYDYEVFFCLTQNKNGQTVIQQWKREEAPAACPMP
jgi:hypothetical protein